MKKQQQRSRIERGFTLVELLVAIAILAILGTVAFQGYFRYIGEANQTAAKAKAETIFTQLMMYKRKHHQMPRDLQTLTEPDERNFNEPWIEAEDIYDPWGNPFVLVEGERSGKWEVVSYGANNQADGFTPDLGEDMDISSARPLVPLEDT